MEKKIKIPLLKDNHNHLTFYALLHDCLSLLEIPNKSRAIEILKQAPKTDVSLVLGWNSGFYQFSEAELKNLPPLIIVNISLHSFLVTPSGREILSQKYPHIMANYQNSKWYEDNMPALLIFLANQVKPTLETFSRFFEYLYGKGVYFAEDMLVVNEESLHLVVGSSFKERTAFWADLNTYGQLSEGARRHIKGIKLFTDGAVGAATAAISQPFSNGKSGYLLFNDEQLHHRLAQVAEYGTAVSIHAIGDDAVAQTLRVLKNMERLRNSFTHIRLEHCQFISKTDARSAKDLGIILSMQPNFSMDSTMYADRLPAAFLAANNPFRMLIDEIGFIPGKDLIFGSDGMPHGSDAALKYALNPPFPQQALTIDEFIAGYCMPDNSLGTIPLTQ